MKVYIAEFRPRDLSKTNFFWKLTLEVVGTGYYHTGMLIGTRYFEMDMRGEVGYRELPFVSFGQLVFTRAHPSKDTIDFVEVPNEFTQEQIDTMIGWWQDKINKKIRYGILKFLVLALAKPFRLASTVYHALTGKVLVFARTEAERNNRVCSIAVDECLKTVGVDMMEHMDESITVPGMSTKVWPIVYKGT